MRRPLRQAFRRVPGAVGRIVWASARALFGRRMSDQGTLFRRETLVFFQHHFILTTLVCTSAQFFVTENQFSPFVALKLHSRRGFLRRGNIAGFQLATTELWTSLGRIIWTGSRSWEWRWQRAR
jgi:hypothetical protein